MKDSTSVIHPSSGDVQPSSTDLLSETKIVAELAKATSNLKTNPKLDWTEWTADYAKMRDAIAETYPQWFSDFNSKLKKPGGF